MAFGGFLPAFSEFLRVSQGFPWPACRVLSFTSTVRSRCITSDRPVAGGWLSLREHWIVPWHGKVFVEASGSTRSGTSLLHIHACRSFLPFLSAFLLPPTCPGITHMYSMIVFDTIEDFEEE
jgi:hypothetical protein